MKDRIKSLRRIPASQLVPHPENWHLHGEEQRAALSTVLDKVGWADALVARDLGNGKYQILDGHLRADIAGNEKVPVLVVDLTEEEGRMVLATHDTLSAMADVNEDQLSDLLEGLRGKGPDLDEMLEQVASAYELDSDYEETPELEDVEPQIDRAEELREKWCVERGQLWIIEGQQTHRLMCGSCVEPRDMSILCEPDKIDLFVTSPPYNQRVGSFSKSGMHRETRWVDNTNKGAYEDDLEEEEYQAIQVKLIEILRDVASSKASLFYNHKNRFRDKQCISPWSWLERADARVRQEIIWMREGSVTQNMRGFMPVDERIFWLYFGTDFVFNDTTEHKTFSTVWKINSHKDREESLHGCAFPIEIPKRCIVCCSNDNDCVMDPYMGSGTTMLAAEQLNRRCYGMEISPAYCAVILQRMTDAGCTCRLAEATTPSDVESKLVS